MNLSEQIMNNLKITEKLCEHATIGSTEDSYEVYISQNSVTGEPYFIYSHNDCDIFYTRILIEKPEYHEYDDFTQALSFKQREALVNFLQSPDDAEPRKTRWQVLLIEWNRNNPSHKVETNLKMPDYMKL